MQRWIVYKQLVFGLLWHFPLKKQKNKKRSMKLQRFAMTLLKPLPALPEKGLLEKKQQKQESENKKLNLSNLGMGATYIYKKDILK